MGLDILCYGGRFMRLSIQGCLILFLGCLSFSVFSADQVTYQAYAAGARCSDLPAHMAHYECVDGTFSYTNSTGSVTPRYWRYYCPEGSSPNQVGENQLFPDATDLSSALVPVFECGAPPVQPEECFEIGQVYDPSSKQCTLNCPGGSLNGQCLKPPENNCTSDRPDYMGAIGNGGVAICENDINSCGSSGTFGIVNGTGTCISDSYGPPTLCPQGSISRYDGYGFTCDSLMAGEQNPLWENPDSQTDPFVNGLQNIFNQNSNIINQNMVTNNNLSNILNQNKVTNNNLSTINNSINNQITTTNNNLTNINDSINQGNQQSQQGVEGLAGQLGQISGDLGALRGMGERGELSGGGVGGDGGDAGTGAGLQSPTGEDYLADLSVIETNTKNTADRLQTLEDGMKSPEGGFNPNGFGGFIPTFEESGTAFISAIEGMSQVQALTKFANIQENTVCPVFTLPSTPVSGEIVMDIHCRVFEDYRAMISALFLFFWSGLSLFVFFKA